MRFLHRLPIQYHIMLLTISLVCLVLFMAGYFTVSSIQQQVQQEKVEQALDLGHLLAQDSRVIQGMESENPSAYLQPFVERWRTTTGANFIVIGNMDQIRITHPIPELIGTPLTDLYREPVLRGEDYVYLGKGALESSLRANVPIFNLQGRQIGFISIGFALSDIHEEIAQDIDKLLPGIIAALLLSVIGSIWLSTKIKQTIYGLEPYQIAGLMQEREATLSAVHEGLISVNRHLEITLLNEEAAVTFAVSREQSQGMAFDRLLSRHHLQAVIQTGQAMYNEEYRVNDSIIVGNSVPIWVEGQVVGAVFTFRDRTEMTRLAEEMTGIHRLVDVLRAQNHEFKNKMHTVAGLVQLGCYDQAVDFIVENTSNQEGDFEKLRGQIKDSVTFGLLLGKCSRAQELGISLVIDDATSLGNLPGNLTSGDLVIILGNLIENAFEAVSETIEKRVRVKICEVPAGLIIEVENSGPAIAAELGDSIFARGISTKGKGRGLGLALVQEKVLIHGGRISYCNLPQGGVLFALNIPAG
ncbi:MAG: sensor histidine kinase [Sporomusaceae bacterium]|nr:sensor histidine kinase [Sporomusaceae bacterium]